ncbi:cellulose synthase catalytic subunit [Klebsiella michiganensis]|nr:cellulose synthase catalytic subunit [Klebsiella michiganensis]
MIRLSTLLLAPPVGKRLNERYRDYRQPRRVAAGGRAGLPVGISGMGVYAAGKRRAGRLFANVTASFFPHINPHRPRPLDPIRYLLQCVWLLATRVPEPDKKIQLAVRWRRWKASRGAMPSGWKSCRKRLTPAPVIWISIKSWLTCRQSCGGLFWAR